MAQPEHGAGSRPLAPANGVSERHGGPGMEILSSGAAAPRAPRRAFPRLPANRLLSGQPLPPPSYTLGGYSGCRADISLPPSCLSPPCFSSKQHIRGWCLAGRAARRTGLAFSWGTFERLLAGPRMHMGGSCWARWENSSRGEERFPESKFSEPPS